MQFAVTLIAATQAQARFEVVVTADDQAGAVQAAQSIADEIRAVRQLGPMSFYYDALTPTNVRPIASV